MADALRKLSIPEDGPGLRGYVRLLAVGVILSLLAVEALNVVVDPRGDFRAGVFRPLVEDIAQEKIQLYRDAAPASVIILGSSRAMPLPPETLDARGFNFAILGGGLLDDRIAYDTVVRTQGPPPRLVLVLDTFQLLDLPSGETWSIIANSRAADLYAANATGLRLAGPLHDALSGSYLGDSLHALDLSLRAGYPTPDNRFLPDGQGLRPRLDPAIANGTYDLPAALEHHWTQFLSKIFVEGAHPQGDQVATLRRLLDRALADGVQVQVILPPFHAAALARVESSASFQELLHASLETVQGLCRPGLSLFDYTEVAAFGGQPDGFYDNYHVTPANGALLLAALQQGRGDLCR